MTEIERKKCILLESAQKYGIFQQWLFKIKLPTQYLARNNLR